jgi:hypothetical protein
LVAYLTAAIAVTVIGALVALALAFRAGDAGQRRRHSPASAPAPMVESEIDISESAAGGNVQR